MPDEDTTVNQPSDNWQSSDVGGLGAPPSTDANTPSSLSSLPDEPAANPILPDEQASSSLSSPTDTNDLLDIKTKALSQLSPIVNHLDQTPEEKFQTTMMMIQASDNQSLIKDAYEAAQHITDEKVKAQALLDVVNEINYFTRQAAK